MTRRARGTGTIERRLRGGRVRYYPRLPGRDRVPLDGFYDTERAAAEALDEALSLNAAGLIHVRTTLSAYGDKVIDRRELEGYRNTKDERRRWRSYVTPWECAAWPIEHVKRKHCAEWLRALGPSLADQTRTNALNLLRAVFRAAVDDELIEANPVADLRVKRTGRTRETSTFLTLDELAGLFWSADDEGRHLIAFAAGSGLRQGELRALLAEDVHLDGDRPHVVVRFGAPGKPTKNGKIRRVPLFGIALAAARSWADGRRRHAREVVAGDGSKHGPREGATNRGRLRPFFATPTGCARQKGHVVDRDASRWRAWLTAAGVARVVRWHDLRHTCATLLLTGRLTPEPWALEAVKEMLGHSSISVTERYAKATGDLAEAAARIPQSRTEAAHAPPRAEPTAASASIDEPQREAQTPPRSTAPEDACDLPTVSQLPTGDPLTTRIRSRLRDLNSRPTVYEGVAILNGGAALPQIVGYTLGVELILHRAATVGDVSRRVVEAAIALLEAVEADGLTVVQSTGDAPKVNP